MGRLEASTLEELRDLLREDGFLLAPLDVIDFSLAQLWIVQRRAQLEKRQIADEQTIVKVLGNDQDGE